MALSKSWKVLARAVARADVPQLGALDVTATTKELVSELRAIESLLKSSRRNAEKRSRRADALLTEMLLGFSVIFRLAMTLDLRAKYEQRLLWEDESLPLERVRILFQNFLLALASILLSIRRNIIEGDVAAGRILARTYLELWDLLVAVVADQATFKAYAEWLQSPEDATAHWRKNVSPGHVKRIVEGFWRSLKPSFGRHFRRFGDDAYARWSATVHGNPIALFTAVYLRAGRTNRPGLAGRFGPDAEVLARDICWLNFQNLTALWSLLGQKHEWSIPTDVPEAEDARKAYLQYRVLQSFHIVRRINRTRGKARARLRVVPNGKR